jgi:hypothetical protein
MACPQNRAAGAQYLSVKSARKRITLGVRSSIGPSYSGTINLSINPACQLAARWCADRGILRRAGNPFDPFRVSSRNMPKIRLEITCQFCGAGMYEKAA